MRNVKQWMCICLLLLSCLPSVVWAQKKTLKFQEGRFKIMQLTDLHWKGGEAFAARNDSTWNLIDRMLLEEKPQLVVLTGDVVVTVDARKSWKRLAKVFKKHRTPWMVTFGNHDTEAEITTQKAARLLSALPYCLMPKKQPEVSGIANVAVPVWNEEGSEMEWMIYFMDSHAYPAMEDMGAYDWIKNDQIDWYRRERDAAQLGNHGKPVPGVAFFHIPLPEFAANGELCTKVGSHLEKVCSPVLNSGLLSAFLEKRDVAGVFCGHDHNNDYLLDYKGYIALAYGRKTGYVSAYKELLPRGVRVIELQGDKRTFRTYVRDLQGVSQPYDFVGR